MYADVQVIVPVLLFIVVLCFYWAIFLPYAGNGIIHLFSPSWGNTLLCVAGRCNCDVILH